MKTIPTLLLALFALTASAQTKNAQLIKEHCYADYKLMYKQPEGALHEYYNPETGAPIMNKGFQNWNYLVLNMLAWLERRPVVRAEIVSEMKAATNKTIWRFILLISFFRFLYRVRIRDLSLDGLAGRKPHDALYTVNPEWNGWRSSLLQCGYRYQCR